MRRAVVALSIAVAALAFASAALASWQSSGSGSGYSRAKTIPAGNTPSANVSNRKVTVSWSASTLPGGGAVGGYLVNRYNTGGTQQTIGADCSGTIAALTCTEKAVPAGSWKYTVTPVLANWLGAASAMSAAANVASPNLTLDSSNLTSLPTDLTGQITSFVSGQTVTFRLDDPTTGQLLSGDISPSPVPSNGTSGVSVTIPAGTSNGAHTVYAIGDQGDTASATITVAVPINAYTWNVADASSGPEATANESGAFANDGVTQTSDDFPSSFSTSRYLQFELNSPLQPGLSVSGASFNFDFASSKPGNGNRVCFYFDVRRISTGSVIATHGSSSSPVSCQAGTTLKATTTPLPEVTSTDIASDLRIRVYATSQNGNAGVTRDLSTVSGSAGGSAFTLYDINATDASSGAPSTNAWGFVDGDGAYQSASAWPNSFSTSRYLKLTFPSYVPSTASVSGASFKHSYRSVNGGTTCYYFEVLSGSTVIGTHGSSSNPVSCSSSTSTYVTDTVSLPEVDTAALANAVTTKLYVRNSASPGGNPSQHDLAQLEITYQP
jgi:hypothetical protein